MALLEVKNIYKSFGGVKAIQNFSIEANAGEIHGIIGPNGAGKTTIFNTISAKVLHALSLQNRGEQIACPPQNGTRLSALPEKPYADALSRAAWHVGV